MGVSTITMSAANARKASCSGYRLPWCSSGVIDCGCGSDTSLFLFNCRPAKCSSTPPIRPERVNDVLAVGNNNAFCGPNSRLRLDS